jgi:hypothetical protein
MQLITSFFSEVTPHQCVIGFQDPLIMSRPNYPLKQHHIPEKQNVQLHHFKNLKLQDGNHSFIPTYTHSRNSFPFNFCYVYMLVLQKQHTE